MLASKKTRRGVIGAVVLAGVLAISGYALTNTATVYDSYAGDGTGNVDQVTAENIHYVLDSTDPTKINGVNFTTLEPVNTTTGTAYVQMEDGAGNVATAGTSWATYACTWNSGNSDWECLNSSAPTGDVNTADVKSLHVVIAD
jgi:hypothetical protein